MRSVVAVTLFLFSMPCALAQDPPKLQTQLQEETQEELISPTEIFATQAHDEIMKEFDDDLSRFKYKAMRASSFAAEYSNPMREFDNLTPEDRFPERYDDFEDWVEDRLADGALKALENHPNTKDTVDSVISLFNVGAASDWEEGGRSTFTELMDNQARVGKEARRTLNLYRLDRSTERLFGPDHQALARMKWLDYHDGFDDLVRWEGRIQNIQLFGNPRLAIDMIKAEFTYESAKVSVYKARPFGWPVLAQAKFEADPDDTKWGLIFTKEKRDYGRLTDAFLKGQGQLNPDAPLLWKLDFGVMGDNDGTEVGFVFSGRF